MGREEKICDAPSGRMTEEVVKLTEIIELVCADNIVLWG
jgi:hypothetical protein